MSDKIYGSNQNSNALVDALLEGLSRQSMQSQTATNNVMDLGVLNIGAPRPQMQNPQMTSIVSDMVGNTPQVDNSPMAMPVIPRQFSPQQEIQRTPPQLDENGQTEIGRLLSRLGIPLAAAALGVAAPKTLPGAAGFNTGYVEGLRHEDELKLKKQEQQRKDRLYKSGKSVQFIDPITGEIQEVGNVGYKDVVYKGVMSPEQMKQRAKATGEAEFIKENIKQTGKLGTAIKRLALLNKQFEKALPSGDRTPLEQRISGGSSAWAAKMGLINNPELIALKKNVRPMAINLIRAFGEVGNLSQTEQEGAIEIVSQEGLTDSERIAQTKQFIEFALAGANEEGLSMLKNNSDIVGILDAFNIDLGQFSNLSNEQIPTVGGTFNGEKVKSVTRIE